MNLKIGAIIKRLRGERGVTQESLATALGVSPQAISRWEQGGGYPDIELLPAMADFFSVSTDEILGYALSERERALADVKKEMERLSEIGTIEERIAHARAAHGRYPFDFEIRENLACCLYCLWKDTRNTEDRSLLNEAEALCRTVLEDCRDEALRYDAINILISVYKESGRVEKAKECVELLAPMKYCREFALEDGIGDGNTEQYIQDSMDKLTDALGVAITNYVLNEDLPNDPSTWDRKIEMLHLSNRLYCMIYGENLMFYHVRLARNHWLISTYEISQGKEDAALASLENMCRHAVAYDRSYQRDHGKCYTSTLMNGLIYPEVGGEFHELREHSQSYYMLDRLANKRYDGIRSYERFVAIVGTLREYAK